jgi:hypothetical protein
MVASITYNGWQDALRLSNGIVELVIVPSVGGRIMRYGFMGGPNVLWENKAVAGKPIKLGDWANTGGDKVWVWPQDDWPNRMPNAWPPPAALDQAPHQADILDTHTVRLTSGPVIGWGLRCLRTIQLAPKSAQVTLTSTLRKEREGAAFPLGAWAVTQVPTAPQFWARKGSGPLITHTRDPKNSTKAFYDADMLASVQDEILFSVRRLPAPDNAGLAYAPPTDQAQIYCNADDPWFAQNGMTSYTELELTSPLKTLKRSETITLVTRYQLDKINPKRPIVPQIQAIISV